MLANLAQADLERIVDGLAAILDPALKPAELRPILDTDAEMQARVRRLLREAAAGTLKPDEFAYVRAGFFPGESKAYADMLREAGAVKSLALLEKRELGDDRIRVYDVELEKRTLRLRVAVAPDGKLAGFALSPRQN